MRQVTDTTTLVKLLPVFNRFFVYLKKDKKYFYLNFVLIAITIAFSAVLIWMVGQVIDALQNKQFNELTKYLIIFSLLIPVLQGLRYLNRYLYEWLQQRIIYSIRRHMYSHLLALSMPFKGKYAKGDLLTRLGQDIIRIAGLLVIIPSYLFSHSLTFVTYLGILFYINYQLAMLAIFLIPIFIGHQRFFSRKTKQASREFLSWQGKMGGFEEETLSNMQGIVSFGAEPAMLERFDTFFSSFRSSAMRHLLLNNGFVITFELLAALAALFFIGMGVYSIQLGHLTTGELVNFLLYLGYLVVPLQGLSNIPVESQIRIAAAERVTGIVDAIPTVQNANKPVILYSTQGHISFKNIDFSYDKETPILKNLNIEIEPGEFVALVGPSGAGKSTLAKLLLRFYDPDRGQIMIDNHDLKEIDLASLRSQIAVVWQQPFLVNGTVFDNMRLSKADASDSEILHALQIAHAHEFLRRLPDGYETRLGTHGSMLSVGQAQRIALAQAFLRKAPVMLLDEATSALDSHSEHAIQKAYSELHGNCTMIIIAHRYATIAGADRIIYLNGDGSVDVGTHNELFEHHQHYRQASLHQHIK